MENLNVADEMGWRRGTLGSITRGRLTLVGAIFLTALVVFSATLLFGPHQSELDSIQCTASREQPAFFIDSRNYLSLSADHKALAGFHGHLKLDTRRFGPNQYRSISTYSVTQGWDESHMTSLRMSDICSEVELKIKQASCLAHVETIRLNPLADSKQPACGFERTNITMRQDQGYFCSLPQTMPCFEIADDGELTDRLVGELVMHLIGFEIDRELSKHAPLNWTKGVANCIEASDNKTLPSTDFNQTES